MKTPIYTSEFVERGYNNRAAVPEHPQWFLKFAELSAAARDKYRPRLDLRYGPGPKETLDLFLPAGRPRGTFVFIHGGYWRALDKNEHLFVAGPMVEQDIAVAIVNYDLCPSVSIAEIVDECRRAVTWVVREGPSHGVNAANVVVAGHSAGGHLAAMMLTIDWRAHGFERAPFAGAVTLSGVHELAPLVQFSFNTDFRLDDAEAARMSPVHLPVRVDAPLLMAVGADETSEFVRQTQLLWDAWPRNRWPAQDAPLVLSGKHHFSVVVDYADPASDLTKATLALF